MWKVVQSFTGQVVEGHADQERSLADARPRQHQLRAGRRHQREGALHQRKAPQRAEASHVEDHGLVGRRGRRREVGAPRRVGHDLHVAGRSRQLGGAVGREEHSADECAEHADEQLRLVDLAGGGVLHRDGLPGVVDEQFLAGAMSLAHYQVELAGPVVVPQIPPLDTSPDSPIYSPGEVSEPRV